MDIDAQGLDAKSAYKLLIGTIIPRPVAWVSTVSTAGVGNLAPISFFTCVGRKPPKVSLSLQPREDGTLKDSFVNIRETGEFVTNMATLPQAHAVHRTAVDFAPDVDEFDMVDVEKEPSALVKPPRVKGAPLALECRVDRILSAPDGLHNVVWGEVVNFYVRDDLYINGRIDFGAIAPVGRLAAEYTVVNNTFVPPLEPDVLAEHAEKRMIRLDGKGEEYSPIDTGTWSPSGAVIE
ncbi:flavin reductase family protein [Streptantibioticus ferralitis]|uniref:Flavin reductase family protein n=1 Tax=Streptantibioticus ferralitis TaxID=236510 RepID=A0ABT5Z4W4_9ACTN|nr:flavin reductase family protein [Streptantibioticus ferralitis]MDF2258863.1 flavin reductase family protein [Streptantibioticus ferralitis]